MEKHFFNSNHSDIISEIISFLNINDDQENIVKFIYFCNGYEFAKKVLLNWKKNSHYEEKKDDYGVRYFRNGKLHRDNDFPAIIYEWGEKQWYKNGKLHRENDLPAVFFWSVTKWWKNGKRHRDNNLPAVIYSNGEKQWWKNGELHRDNDLPAIIYPNGEKQWYKNGEFIRKE